MEMLMIHIRFAQKEDIEGIINFLRKHWNGNSILVKSRKIFEYQYCRGDKCHFVIAIDDITNEIYGLKGYIPLNQTETPDIAANLNTIIAASGWLRRKTRHCRRGISYACRGCKNPDCGFGPTFKHQR